MSYIRTKKAKRKDGTTSEYAYIVEAKRNKKSGQVKQITKKYLGRVYNYEQEKEEDYWKHHNIQDIDKYLTKSSKQKILDIVTWELKKRGFKEQKGILINADCKFSVAQQKIYNTKGNNIAIKMNDGLLTSYSLRKLINFEPIIEKDAYHMAKLFIENGLKPPKEIFISIFNKIKE